MSTLGLAPATVPNSAPLPNEGCPPPLRCRDVWTQIYQQAHVWDLLSTRGGTLSGWTLGRGPTVVWIAPFGGTADLFALVAWLLRDEFQSIAIQWNDVGRTRTVSDFAADVWDVVRSETSSAVTLYGTNWSGGVALEAARQRPEDVSNVFVQDGFARRRLSLAERLLARTVLWSPRKLAAFPYHARVQMLNHRRWFPPLDPDRWACFLETTGTIPLAVLARQGLACRGMDFRQRFSDVTTPVWLLSTEGAGPRAHQHHAELQACLPTAQAEWMHTTGSHASFTHPHRIAKFLRQSLGLIPSAAPAESCCGGTDACDVPEQKASPA